MSLTDEARKARYRNLLIVLAREILHCRTTATSLRASAKTERHKDTAAGMRAKAHAWNHAAQRLSVMLSNNPAALREFFGTKDPEKVAKQEIILH